MQVFGARDDVREGTRRHLVRRERVTGLVVGAVGILLLATPVLADAVLPLGSAFGDEAGCEFFMTGHPVADAYIVLTPDTLTTASAGCYFKALTEREGNRYVVAATCSYFGEDSTEEALTVVAEGGMVTLTIGDESVTLLPCAGTEALFGTDGGGVQV